MKKAVIAYLLAVLLISLIGLSVGITVADNPESSGGDGDTHSQDEGGTHSFDPLLGEKPRPPESTFWAIG